MNDGARFSLSRTVAIAAALALLLTGAGAAYLLMAERSGGGSQPFPVGAAAPAPVPPVTEGTTAADTPLPDVIVPLSQDLVDRAGIVVGPVSAGAGAASLRIPGVVEPNAYKQVVVTPIAGGRVTRVFVELGDRVRRGESMAQIYSPELAEAQMRLISLRAEFAAAEQQLKRTERLLEIGAASREELEQVHAAHQGHAAAVAGARSRLVLLGMSRVAIDRLSAASEVTATVAVPAPLDGIITERNVNAGLNVEPSTRIFTVVDLSTVWVVGDLYEQDFPRVRVGSPAVVTTRAYPDRSLEGRVSYIDPQVNPDTRTARVRVEVPNPGQALRLGMLAGIQVQEAGEAKIVTVPRTALQNVGARYVVYLTKRDETGRFVEREVRIGGAVGEQIEVLSGLQTGDVVVTEGSFFVRAERERLGLRPAASGAAASLTPHPASRIPPSNIQTAQITVTDEGFEPASVTFKPGLPARLTFVRTSDKTCATEIVVPALNIRRPLPLNQQVTLELPAPKAGKIAFTCGMNMLRGTVVVQ